MTKNPLPWYQPALAHVEARVGREVNLGVDCQSFAEILFYHFISISLGFV